MMAVLTNQEIFIVMKNMLTKDLIIIFLLVVNITIGMSAYDEFYQQKQELNGVKKQCKSMQY